MSQQEKLLLPDAMSATRKAASKAVKRVPKQNTGVDSKTGADPSKSGSESSTRSGKATAKKSRSTRSVKATAAKSRSLHLKDGNSDKSDSLTPIPDTEPSSLPCQSGAESSTRSGKATAAKSRSIRSVKATAAKSRSVRLKDGNSDRSDSLTPIPDIEPSSLPGQSVNQTPDLTHKYVDDAEAFSVEAEPIVSSDYLLEPIVSSGSFFECTTTATGKPHMPTEQSESQSEETDVIPKKKRKKPCTLTETSNKAELVKTSGSAKVVEEEPKDSNIVALLMQSIEHVLNDVSDVLALETPVVHFELGYAGTLDCMAKYR